MAVLFLSELYLYVSLKYIIMLYVIQKSFQNSLTNS